MFRRGILAGLATTSLGKLNKHWLQAFAVCLGLAGFSSATLAQEQAISVGARGSISVRARFQIWRTTTLGSYKGVDAYRDALDAAKIKIGDAADEILGRPAFPYVSGKMDVELTVVSAAELGVESEFCSCRRLQPCKATWSGVVPCRGGTAVATGLSRSATRRILIVAMEPVNTHSGDPTILSLVNFSSGLALLGSDGRSEFMVPRYVRFVFAIPGKLPLEAQNDPSTSPRAAE